MTIQELEQIMVENAVTIKAIPEKVVSIFEKSHLNEYPNGCIQYLEQYKREMLVVETVPKNAGKFVIGRNTGNSSVVRYEGKFYNSIEEAVADLLNS